MVELAGPDQGESIDLPSESMLLDRGFGLKSTFREERSVEVKLICVKCWATFEGWLQSTCPRCGELRPSAGWATMPFTFRERYLFTELLGRGGMGAVFLAYDEQQLDEDKRRVAIKVVPQHSLPAARETLKRMFAREAAAAAMLAQSSSFVRVLGHDVGVEPAYLVMEYVDWPTLRALLRRRKDKIRPLSPVKVARIGIALLRGLATMHFHRIVHRDLKPDNVFVQRAKDGDDYEVKILDLGVWTKEVLALTPVSLPPVADTEQAPVGTFSYMSPEQMAMEPVDAASDLHTVGSVLWELCTGRVPYPMRHKDAALATADRFDRLRTPVPRPEHMPEGLYEVLIKALEFDPGHRWENAEEMRSALRVWVAEEILRSQAAIMEVRRHLDELHLRVGILRDGILPQTAILERLNGLSDRLVALKSNAEEASPRSLQRAVVEAEGSFKEVSLDLGRHLKSLERNLLETDVHAGTEDLEPRRAPQAEDLETGDRPRSGPRRRRLWRPRVMAASLAVLIAGGYAAAGLWPKGAPEGEAAAPKRPELPASALSRSSQPKEISRERELRLAPEVITNTVLGPGHNAGYVSAAFAARRNLIASGSADGSVRLFDARTLEAKGELRGHDGAVFDVAFSPDGDQLATACEDGLVRLYDVATKSLIASFAGHREIVRSVAFSADGRALASGGDDGDVRIWDKRGGRPAKVWGSEGPAGRQRKKRKPVVRSAVRSLVFSARTLAAAHEDGTITLFNASTGERLQRWSAHAGGAFAVAFSPDGTRLVSGGMDQKVRVFDAAGRQLQELVGHEHQVRSVAVSPDGHLVASGGLDRTIRIFAADTGRELSRFDAHAGGVYKVAFSTDGKLLASGGHDRRLVLWNPLEGRESRSVAGRSGSVLAVSVDPAGKLIASAGSDGDVRLADAETGVLVRTLRDAKGPIEALAFAPAGDTLAAGGHDGTVRFWESASGALVRTVPSGAGRIRALAYTPQGSLVACGGDGRSIPLFDPGTGQLFSTLNNRTSGLRSLAFSSDGKVLVAGGDDRLVRLYDTKSGELVRTLAGADGAVRAVAVSHDGMSIAASGDDRRVRVYDARTGELTRQYAGHEGSVRALAFSPSTQMLASGGVDRAILLWGAGSLPVARLEGHQLSLSSLAFLGNGERVVSGALDSTVRIWHWSSATWMAVAALDDGWVIFDDRGELRCKGAKCPSDALAGQPIGRRP